MTIALADKFFTIESRTNRIARPSLATGAAEMEDLVSRRAIAEVQAKSYDLYRLPEIDLSIVTYHSWRMLPSFFESLLSQRYPIRRIHLLMCQHSENVEDDAAVTDFIRRQGGRFGSVVRIHATNGGFGAGHNTNFQAAKTDYFFISNVDLQFELDTLPALVHLARNSSRNVACFEARQSPLEHPKYYNPGTLETSWCSGCALLVKSRAYREVGGFDESFFMYGEDVDLSLRLRAHKHKLAYCPWAVVLHCPDPDRRSQLMVSSSIKASLILSYHYGGLGGFARRIAAALYLARRRALPQNVKEAIRRGIADWRAWLMTKYGHSYRSYWDRLRARSLFRRMKNGLDYEWRRPFVMSIPKGALASVPAPSSTSLVSIIIRYSGGRRISFEHALRSACFQTHPTEVVVVEDGVSEIGRLIELYQAAGFNIVHVSVDKIGRAAAASLGISLAQGKYVCFLDDDDYLFLNHVEVLLRRLDGGERVDAAAGWAVCAQATKSWNVPRDVQLDLPRWYSNEYSDENLVVYNYFPIQSVLFRRADAIRIGRFDPSLDLLEDWNFFARLLHRKRVDVVRQTTSVYRVPRNPVRMRLRRRRLEACEPAVRTKIVAARNASTSESRRVLRLVYHRFGSSPFDPYGMFVDEVNFRDQIAILLDRKKLGIFGDGEGQLGLELHFDDGYQDVREQFEAIPQLAELDTTIFLPTRVLSGSSTLVSEVIRAALADDVSNAKLVAELFPHAAANTPSQLYFEIESALKKCDKATYEEIEAKIGKTFPRVVETDVRTMSRRELTRLVRAGSKLGGHGHSHRSFSALDKDELVGELSDCWRILKDVGGQAPEAFAFPFGTKADFSTDSVREVRSTGFREIFWSGEKDYDAGTGFVLGRFQVGNLDKFRFANQLDQAIGLLCGSTDPSEDQLRFCLARAPIFVKNFHLGDRSRVAAH